MTSYDFDDRHIPWQRFEEFDHLQYFIFDIDRERQVVDVLFKFAGNEQIVLHRHKVLNHTFVIKGEHRLYEPNGEVKEVRPVGSYTVSPASDEPHREGGGDEDVVVFFSIRGSDGVLYEILDDDQNVIGTLSMEDFAGLHEAQPQAG